MAGPGVMKSDPEVSEGVDDVRPRDTSFRLPPVGGSRLCGEDRPSVTLLLAAGLVAAYLVHDPLTLELWAVTREALTQEGWFRLVSASLHHADWLHLLGNVAGLFVFGRILERSLGAAAVLVVVLGSALAGAVCSAAFNGTPSIGASGGVYGLFGTWMLVGGRARPPLRLAAVRLPKAIWALLIAALVFDNFRPLWPWPLLGDAAETRVDWIAHVGGALCGLGFGVCTRRSVRPLSAPPRLAWVRWSAMVCVLLYVSGWAVGAARWIEGRPEALAGLSDGPRKWIALNNAAWEAAQDPGTAPSELEAWLGPMQEVVLALDGQPEFADTLATLQHRLGNHREAVAIESRVSREHELPVYIEQLARFAWAQLKAGSGAEPAAGRPVRIQADWSAREGGALELRLLEPSQALPLTGPETSLRGLWEVDAICELAGTPHGLLRVAFHGSATPVVIPVSELGRERFDGGPPGVACQVAHQERTPPDTSPIGLPAARYWPIAPGVFEPLTH